MTKQQVIEKLQEKLDRIPGLRNKSTSSIEFKEWKNDTKIAIERLVTNEKAVQFNKISYSPAVLSLGGDNSQAYYKSLNNGLNSAEAMLKSMIKEVDEYWVEQTEPTPNREPITIIENICRKFRDVARQLRDRHAGRPTIDINDEYDVQDLLHGLLRLHFDDIRSEEWVPSYAGGSKRMDFLLKKEQVVIEVKKTRDKLNNKELGEQLIIDIANYKEHQDCKTLICFVYDPEGRITNPQGLITDLGKYKEPNVKVFIE